jgi:hypothetical protein
VRSLRDCFQSDGALLLHGRDDLDHICAEHDYVFVMFCTAWASRCRKLEPTWHLLAERARKNTEANSTTNATTIVVAKVDCVESQSLCHAQNVISYPTLWLFRHHNRHSADGAGKECNLPPVSYYGERTVDAMLDFVQQKVKEDSITCKNQKSHRRDYDGAVSWKQYDDTSTTQQQPTAASDDDDTLQHNQAILRLEEEWK